MASHRKIGRQAKHPPKKTKVLNRNWGEGLIRGTNLEKNAHEYIRGTKFVGLNNAPMNMA